MAVVTPWGWTQFFDELSRFLRSADRQYGLCDEQYCDYAINRFETAVQNVDGFKERVQTADGSVDDTESLHSISLLLTDLHHELTSLLQQWQEYSDRIDAEVSIVRYSAPLHHHGDRGRPAFSISRQQLEYLRSLSFSWTEIASLLGVSRMTIYRRRAEFGLLDDPSRTLNDEELSRVVVEMRRELPEIGQLMVAGRLRSMGYQIPRHRVRDAVRSSDPLNTALRWHGVTTRRPYSVPGPTSLWHIG